MTANTRLNGLREVPRQTDRESTTSSGKSVVVANEETRLTPEIIEACRIALGRCREVEQRQLRLMILEGATDKQIIFALNETTYAPRPSMRYALAIVRRLMAAGIQDGAAERRRYEELRALQGLGLPPEDYERHAEAIEERYRGII